MIPEATLLLHALNPSLAFISTVRLAQPGSALRANRLPPPGRAKDLLSDLIFWFWELGGGPSLHKEARGFSEHPSTPMRGGRKGDAPQLGP